MADLINFRTSLQNAGLNLASANAVIAQGFNDLLSFSKIEEDGIPYLVKYVHKANQAHGDEADQAIIIGYAASIRLEALRLAVIWRLRLGDPPNDVATTQHIDKMVDIGRELKKQKKESDGQEPERPPLLKDFAKWRAWWEKWDSYMSQIRGAADIPIRYVYREKEDQPGQGDEEANAASYPSQEAYFERMILLDGDYYLRDNRRVYDTLKNLVIDGPGWAFIRQYETSQNGRAAVLALKRQAEGDSAIATRKARAYTDIAKARYVGPRKDYSFDKYVHTHQNAHNELADLGEPVAEMKKVRDFLDGITDPRLAAGLDYVMGEARLSDDFEECQQYLRGLIARKHEHSRAQRNISEAGSGQRSTKGGRKGSGGDRGKKTLHAGRYSPAEWRKLTWEEKKQVMKMREDGGKAGNGGNKKRSVSEVQREDTAGETTDADEGSVESAEPAKNAGQQFGSKAHGRGKKVKFA